MHYVYDHLLYANFLYTSALIFSAIARILKTILNFDFTPSINATVIFNVKTNI